MVEGSTTCVEQHRYTLFNAGAWLDGRGSGDGGSGGRKSEGRGMFASVASAVADKAKRLSGVKSNGKAVALNTAQNVTPAAPESAASPAAAPAAASTSSAALASLLSQVQSSGSWSSRIYAMKIA